MENSPCTKIVRSEMADGQKGKLLHLWTRCIAKPSELLGSSIKHLNFASKCRKYFPEMSLSCQFSASFSLNSAKSRDAGEEVDSESRERCKRIVEIEHEIRTLERRLQHSIERKCL